MKTVKRILVFIYEMSIKYPVIIAVSFFLILISIFALTSGKQIQIGGILKKLWGLPSGPDPDVRLIPPSERKKSDGTPIDVGEPDKHGYVQSPVQVKIEESSIFSEPDVVVVTHPIKGEVKLPLPVGVKNEDIERIVEIEPDVYQIENNDTGVDVSSLLDDLEKNK